MLQQDSKYQFIRALRPFSFSVALITCLTGISVASQTGPVDLLMAVITIAAAVVLQAGVNLINDYADLDLTLTTDEQLAIQRNFRWGMGCFLLATFAAIYLILHTGTSLLWLCLLGAIGALGYTLDPVNYKARGLGVPMVFWLMGVLMVSGSYMIQTGEVSWQVFWLSIPISLLVALLLLSNEIRDYEQDQRDGIATLSGRIGFYAAIRLYQTLIVAAAVSAVILYWQGLLAIIWPLLLLLPLLFPLHKQLDPTRNERTELTPQTGRLLFVFGVIYNLIIWFG